MSAPAPAPAPKEEVIDVLEVRARAHLRRRTLRARARRFPVPPAGSPDQCAFPPQEDDEFEEFEQQEWTSAAEDAEDPAMWQDGWEDDEDTKDFTAQLRAELTATESSAPPPVGLAGLLPTSAMQQ